MQMSREEVNKILLLYLIGKMGNKSVPFEYLVMEIQTEGRLNEELTFNFEFIFQEEGIKSLELEKNIMMLKHKNFLTENQYSLTIKGTHYLNAYKDLINNLKFAEIVTEFLEREHLDKIYQKLLKYGVENEIKSGSVISELINEEMKYEIFNLNLEMHINREKIIEDKTYLIHQVCHLYKDTYPNVTVLYDIGTIGLIKGLQTPIPSNSPYYYLLEQHLIKYIESEILTFINQRNKDIQANSNEPDLNLTSIQSTIDKYSSQINEVLTLRYIKDKTQIEVSSTLGISIDTVKQIEKDFININKIEEE